MQTLKVDRTKLKTVKNYAESKKIDRQRVYYLIKKGELKTEIIDGVIFIKLD